VERLRDQHRIGARRPQRQLLGRPAQRLDPRQPPDELRPHLGERLDRHHAPEAGDEVARQLAGPGREVDDGRAAVEAELVGEAIERRRWIGGAAALVLAGGLGERGGKALRGHGRILTPQGRVGGPRN